MIEQTETQILVQVVVDVPAKAMFAVLGDPARHSEIDGSGMLRGAVDAEPIAEVGQVFTMQMHDPARGDYRTVNEVLTFEPDRVIAWATADEGEPPTGVRWRWQLTPNDRGRTTVVHTYDWTNVSESDTAARAALPRVPAHALRRSITLLVAAAGG